MDPALELITKLKALRTSKREHAENISSITRKFPKLIDGTELRAPGFKAAMDTIGSDIGSLDKIIKLAMGIEDDIFRFKKTKECEKKKR